MNWLKNLLEETSYEFYLNNNPEMVKHPLNGKTAIELGIAISNSLNKQ